METLTITSHQGNVSQNHNEIPLHTPSDDYNKKNFLKENNEHWRRCGQSGVPAPCWWERATVQPLWKSLTIPQKVKHGMTQQLHSSEEVKTRARVKYTYAHVYGSAPYNSQEMETTEMPN